MLAPKTPPAFIATTRELDGGADLISSLSMPFICYSSLSATPPGMTRQSLCVGNARHSSSLRIPRVGGPLNHCERHGVIGHQLRREREKGIEIAWKIDQMQPGITARVSKTSSWSKHAPKCQSTENATKLVGRRCLPDQRDVIRWPELDRAPTR
jgi:hypothetical protein